MQTFKRMSEIVKKGNEKSRNEINPATATHLVLAFDIGAFDHQLKHVIRATFLDGFQQLISSFRDDIRCGISGKSVARTDKTQLKVRRSSSAPRQL